MTTETRNPFGVMDVPDPDGEDVIAFAATASLDGGASDSNAAPWAEIDAAPASIEGRWSSRWNGGADPAIPGDSADQWKPGSGEARRVGDRVFLSFDWHHGARLGLIEARYENDGRMTGKYINLSSPEIVQPWIGRHIDDRRIDGMWPGGRLDFRR
ncbi:hypothetical protein ACVWZA_002412 [Sphingomonas sp. UYAg733]